MKKLSFLFIIVLLFSAVSIVYADINEELLKAAREGNIEAVKTLLDKGADINTKTNDIFGNTALMEAVVNEDIDMVKLLIEKGADINMKYLGGFTALIYTVSGRTGKGKNYIIAKLLIEKGADVNAKDDKGQTALIRLDIPADIAKLLIEKGADVNAKNNSGLTPLMVAST